VLLCARRSSDGLLQKCCGVYPSLVFLDKVCIHPTNTELQRETIVHLGAFIKRSEQMVVLYSDIYLKKLWTVYEVASFLALHPIDKMKVLAVHKFPALVIANATLYMQVTVYTIVLTYFSPKAAQLVAVPIIISYYPALSVLRQWARSKQAIPETLRHFKVREALCVRESDRPLVNANIADLMRGLKVVPQDANEDDALDSFDEKVRELMPGAFHKLLGRSTFSFKHYMILGFARTAGDIVDSVNTHSREKMLLNFVERELLWHTLCGLVAYPTSFLFAEIVTQTCLHWTGWQERLYVVFCLCLCTVPTYILEFVVEPRLIDGEELRPSTQAVLFLFLGLWACALFRLTHKGPLET